MIRYRRLLSVGLVTMCMAAALTQVRTASAIPAWSRMYGTSCDACHIAGFKLNRAGQNFLRSGHSMRTGEEKAELGNHLSVAQKLRYNYSKGKNDDGSGKKVTNSFEQHALSLYMGGALQKQWSYFAELYWHENSGNTAGASDLNDFGRSKLADAYIQYFVRQDEERYTSFRFGQFAPYLLHLHGVGARLSGDRAYVINSGSVGSNPYKPFTRQYGFEASHYYKGLNVAAAIMNGTGGKLFNRVDNDLKKDGYATVDYSFDDRGSMLGVYGYLGHYPLSVDDPVKFASGSYDNFNQIGVLGNYTRKEGALVGAFFAGKNKYVLRKDFAAPVDTTDLTVEPKSMGYYAELQIYGIHPRIQPFVRWDFWDPDTDVNDNEVLGPEVGVSCHAMDNGRIVTHFQQLKTKNSIKAHEFTENKVVVEVNFMF